MLHLPDFLPSYTYQSLPPAQLWVGPQPVVHEKVVKFLQSYFCFNPHPQDALCLTCDALAERRHHSVQWISPKQQYTLEDLTPLLHTLSFSLETNQSFFFILTQVESLTIACANRLLKLLEEPPAGYHFILLTQRYEPLPATIRSRCATHTFRQNGQPPQHPLFGYFTTKASSDPVTFAKSVEQASLQEQETILLLEQLVAYWITQCKRALQDGENSAYQHNFRRVQLFAQALMQPPMPGSSSLFWKNLFLQMRSLR